MTRFPAVVKAFVIQATLFYPSKHETLIQCCFDVGPHQNNISSMSRVCYVLFTHMILSECWQKSLQLSASASQRELPSSTKPSHTIFPTARHNFSWPQACGLEKPCLAVGKMNHTFGYLRHHGPHIVSIRHQFLIIELEGGFKIHVYSHNNTTAVYDLVAPKDIVLRGWLKDIVLRGWPKIMFPKIN